MAARPLPQRRSNIYDFRPYRLNREEDDWAQEDLFAVRRRPYYEFMLGKYKHNVEVRKALDVSKLEGLTTQQVRRPYRTLYGNRMIADNLNGSVHVVENIPLTYYIKGSETNVTNKI